MRTLEPEEAKILTSKVGVTELPMFEDLKTGNKIVLPPMNVKDIPPNLKKAGKRRKTNRRRKSTLKLRKVR